MARFMADEGVGVPVEPEAWDDWRFAHNACWERPAGDVIVAEYERLLDFGYRVDALTKDRRARLLSNESHNHAGAWGELRAACWFDGAGFRIKQWDPPARKGRKGEFLVRRGTLELFVEAKAFRGHQAYQDLERAGDLVARDVHRWLRQYPGLTFGVYMQRTRGSHRRYEAREAKRSVMAAARSVSASDKAESVEIPVGGAVAVVEVNQGDGSAVSRPMTPGVDRSLRRLLNKVQKPAQPIPAVAVIDDVELHVVKFRESSSRDIVAEALHGTPWTDITGGIERLYRKRNGLWSRRNPSSLSAVFVLGRRYEDDHVERQTWGYLNPTETGGVLRASLNTHVDRWVEPGDWKQ